VPRISAATRDERQQRFIEAAWRCAARRGFGDTTVDDVCTEAGLSKGAFYGYFESKQALLLALLAEDARTVDEVIEELSSLPITSADRLRRFAHAALAHSAEAARVQLRADLWTAMMSEQDVRHALAEAVQRRRVQIRAWVEAGVAAGELKDIPANAFASLLLALSDGLLLHGGLDPSAFRWPNIRAALDILLGGAVQE
jgi:AcrR family transcriptional regulator